MKLCVNVNGVSYYTTKSALRKRKSSECEEQNVALSIALDLMNGDEFISKSIAVYDDQMQRHGYKIRIEKVMA